MNTKPALSAPDQWESDLSDLLGLKGAPGRRTMMPERRVRAGLFALATVALIAAGIASLVLVRRWGMPVHDRSAIHATAGGVAALPPRSAPQERVAGVAVLPPATDRQLRAGADDHVALRLSAVPAGQTANVRKRSAPPIVAARQLAYSNVASPAAERRPLSIPAGNDASGSDDHARRSGNAAASSAATPLDPATGDTHAGQPVTVINRQTSTVIHVSPGEKKDKNGTIEAIDAMRLLRRQ